MGGAKNVDMADEENDSVLASFQVFLCLFNTLTASEARLQQQTETQKHLLSVSLFLQHVTTFKQAKQSSVHKEVASHLYHLHQSITLKTAKLHRGENSFRQSLNGYLVTAVIIMAGEFSFLVGEGLPVLNVIEAAGLEYSALGCLCLLALASNGGIESSSISDKSSPAIYLASKVFENCLRKQGSLEVIESILFILHRVPISVESEAIIVDRIKLIFENERDSSVSQWLH